jgi:hypothetical protein
MDFNKELDDLIARSAAGGASRDEVISALELKLMALKEQAAGGDAEAGEAGTAAGE